jgi:hypothetical protein
MGPGLSLPLPWMLWWLAAAIIPLLLARLAMRRPTVVRWGPSELLSQAARSSRITRGGVPWLRVIVRGLLLATAATAAARPLWRPPAGMTGLRSTVVGRQVVAGASDSRIAILSPETASDDTDAAVAIRRGLESLAGTAGTLGRSPEDDAAPPTVVEAAVHDLPLLPTAPRSLLILADQPPPAAADTRRLTAAVEAGAGLLVCIGPRAVADAEDCRRLSNWLDELAGVTVAGRLSLDDAAIEVAESLSAPAAADTGVTTLAGPGVTEAADLVVVRPATVLARATPMGRPLLVESRRGRGVVCVSALPLAFSMRGDGGMAAAWSDLAAWPAFIPFIDRLVTRLLAASAAAAPGSTEFAAATSSRRPTPVVPLAPPLLAVAIACLLADWWLSSRAADQVADSFAAALPHAGRAVALAVLATMGLAWAGLPAGRQRSAVGRRPVALLIDNSPSMAGRSAAPPRGRLDAVLEALTTPATRGSPLEQVAGDRPLAVFAAAADLVPLGEFPGGAPAAAIHGLEAVAPAASASRIGTAIEAIIQAGDDGRSDDGPPLPAAIVVASDGAITAGASWASAARMAAVRGVPLVAIPAAADEGSAGHAPPPGFRVTSIRTPRLCRSDEPLAVVVEAEATAPAGPLELRMSAAAGGPTLARASLDSSPSADGMSARFSGRLTAPPGSFTGTEPRLVSPVISVYHAAAAAESAVAALTCPLAVADAPLRVLFIESAPRFEYRFLERLLSRDRAFDVQTCMLDPRALGRSRTLPLPLERSEWNRFDVVILGDVPAAAQPADRAASWRTLREAAAKDAVGIAWLPGPLSWNDPDAGLSWLPAVPGGIADSSMPRRLQATAGGRTGGWLPPAEDAAGGTGLHPEVFAVLRPAFLRPTARIIVRAAANDASAPAAFVDRLGSATILGQLCETWRWRRHDERAYAAYWRGVLRRLAEPHQLGRLLAATPAVRPSAPVAGDAVQIEIVPTRGDVPLAGWHVEVTSRSPTSPPRDGDVAGVTGARTLPAADVGGSALVTIAGLSAGLHAVRLVPPDGAATDGVAPAPLVHELIVAEPVIETAESPSATAAMERAARESDGEAVGIDTIARLPDAVAAAAARAERATGASSAVAAGGWPGWLGSPAAANLLLLLLVLAAVGTWWQRRGASPAGSIAS